MSASFRIHVLEWIGPIFQRFRWTLYFYRGYKNISKKCILERDLNLDRVYPNEIYVGDETLIASRVTILCHEHVYRDPKNYRLPLKKPVHIGKRCFIGVSAMILPGVSIGDNCVIGAGCVVNKNIPPGCLVVGNPFQIKRTGIVMSAKAIIDAKKL
jgi:acetyltransferase-like isoleucine patch superfamily enzyme